VLHAVRSFYVILRGGVSVLISDDASDYHDAIPTTQTHENLQQQQQRQQPVQQQWQQLQQKQRHSGDDNSCCQVEDVSELGRHVATLGE